MIAVGNLFFERLLGLGIGVYWGGFGLGGGFEMGAA